VKNGKEQQERTKICRDEIDKIMKKKDAVRKILTEEMRRRSTQAE
jgi:hypothetical protein